MKDIFYRPTIGPEREYYSEKEFEDPAVPSPPIAEEPETPASFEDVVEEIDKIIKNINILPVGVIYPIQTILIKIKDDIKDTTKPKVPVQDPEDPDIKVPDPEDPEDKEPEPEDPEDDDPPPRDPEDEDPEGGDPGRDPVDDVPTVPTPNKRENEVILTEGKTRRISLFPEDNGINVTLQEKETVTKFVETSFLKDKADMYGNFVKKLKMTIQQYMREILYVSKIGGFDDYRDLYIRYDVPTDKLPATLKHVGDRLIKSQITRDERTRMLSKTFSIDQTIHHLIANKATYEQRQRYYQSPYIPGTDYLSTKENDELRKIRADYDKKYEGSMYNYYKYLNSSVIVAEEILQGFVSEARGKAILKRSGIDPFEGYKKEKSLRDQREEEYRQKNEKEFTSEMAKKTSKIELLKKAGKLS